MTDVLRILIAPLVWLAAFSAVYGLHGIICGQGIDTMEAGAPWLARILLVGAYALAIMVQIAVLAALYAPRFASPSPFVGFVSQVTGWVGLAATIWSLLPTAFTTYCG